MSYYAQVSLTWFLLFQLEPALFAVCSQLIIEAYLFFMNTQPAPLLLYNVFYFGRGLESVSSEVLTVPLKWDLISPLACSSNCMQSCFNTLIEVSTRCII